jgi:predicted PhzF superfamily epimerase YddE/YHI9
MTDPELYVVDAFTEQAFAGNPAGVVLLDAPRPDAWMQSVAAELGFSETAFVTGVDEAVRDLRWFTPAVEVDLCGHATLAAAHVLGGSSVFRTRSGQLRCVATDGWIEMDFPADPAAPAPATDDLRRALNGIRAVEIGRGVSDLLVQVGSEAEVRDAAPDLAALAEVPVRGLIVTARGDGPADIVSRCFYPAVGVPEDPVTGSAHCTLASWWCPRLDRTDLLARQLSARGGVLRIGLRGDRVSLAGRAVTVVRGAVTV